MLYTFDQFLQNDKWTSLQEHYSDFNLKLEDNINTALVNNRKDEVRKTLIKENRIRKANPTLINDLKKELVAGNVVAIDGTCANYDLTIVGFQARIGIIAINYKNYKSGYTIYISDPFIPFDKETVKEILTYAKEKKAGRSGLSQSHVTSIMLYKEREFILNREEKYKIVQGDIFPYELRYGQGRLRGLSTCLKLGRKLLSANNIIATQTTTSDPLYRILGLALEEGEYFVLGDYYDDLETFLTGGDDERRAAHFNEGDTSEFKRFVEDVRNKFRVGLYKAIGSKRAYVFYAPTNNLETMVNLLFADSSYQPLRGFPLLLDYADSICTRLLSASDFYKQIEWKLAKKKILEVEINEKSLRRR